MTELYAHVKESTWEDGRWEVMMVRETSSVGTLCSGAVTSTQVCSLATLAGAVRVAQAINAELQNEGMLSDLVPEAFHPDTTWEPRKRRTQPKLPLFESGDPTLSEKLKDEL